ncbi:2Fe-2S iron-sulfur cluster-binding protein [Novosphingobium sp. HBC54]|uniref:2Fe-2S iron-sulfur cluster-binding protein n=2 Tax=Novosphingobium cyanobacteriorum TaxID=3024215 RepID=A0ABT6CMW2_9SPHN|nr:2Fe-2S iron-sulfur cluster-binding protein [Novosphingobium cyanobacteriorum]
MVRITFVQHGGAEHEIEAAPGETLMRTALDNDVPGIIGECGGELACATCHCYLDPTLLKDIEPASADELDMLQGAIDATADSRLSCQVLVTRGFAGTRIRLPASQI